MSKTCNERKRSILQTMQGVVREIESKRLLLLAILDERPELAEEIYTKANVLQANLDGTLLALSWIEAAACAMCGNNRSELGAA